MGHFALLENQILLKMRKLSIVLVLLCFPFVMWSQNTIAGRVVDELGLPIYLATVSINGTEESVHTDYEGNFTLSSNKNFHWKITLSSSGYDQESFFVLSGGSTGNLTLKYDEAMRKLLVGAASPGGDP